jgi:hypothetical protein
MKNTPSFFVVCTVLTACFKVYSQSFTTSVNSTTTTIAMNVYVTSVIEFQNTSPDSLTLKWDLLEKITPSGWDYSFCDYNTCYDGTTLHGTMATLDTNGIGFIKVNAMTNSESWSYFKFRVYNKNAASDSDTIEFWFNGTLSLSALSAAEMVFCPNPVNANEVLMLKSANEVKSVEWIALDGKSKGVIDMKQDMNQPLRSPDEPGLYLMRIETVHGFINRRIVVQ